MEKPTAAQEKKWLIRIARYSEEHGAFPLSDTYNVELHHVKGREFKHNKTHIGRWFVIPMMKDFHNTLSDNQFNVSNFPKRYTKKYGLQVEQFVEMCDQIELEDGELPFSSQVYDAIRDLRV